MICKSRATYKWPETGKAHTFTLKKNFILKVSFKFKYKLFIFEEIMNHTYKY